MNEAQNKPVVLVHSDKYANWVFDKNHPTQGRRFINARNLFLDGAKANQIEVREVSPSAASRTDLERVHSVGYVAEVLDQGISNEWNGPHFELASIAHLFVGGTLFALEQLLNGETNSAIHFPGAKHHAQYDHSSGFCVFADFAIAADIATKKYGKKVAILDIDAHHGDGTENLTQDNPSVLSYSIHEHGIFPGTGSVSIPEKQVFNYPLGITNGKGQTSRDDSALVKGVENFLSHAINFQPDLLFIACGADGHREDPLSTLTYSLEGYISVAKFLRGNFPKMPILVGGAGGYLPDTRTPEVWSQFALAISQN